MLGMTYSVRLMLELPMGVPHLILLRPKGDYERKEIRYSCRAFICMRYDTRSLILVVVISSNICVRVSGIVIRCRVV